jgi:hypothetical protein
MRRIPPSFLFRFLLTAVALMAAMDLGIAGLGVRPAQAQSCPNTECHGWQMCRYAPRVICAISTRDGPCTAWHCT